MHQAALVMLWAGACSVWRTGGVQIVNCKTSKLYLYEDEPEPVTCRNISKDGRNTWKNNGDNRIIGQCTADGDCKNYSTALNSLTRGRNSDESQLEFSRNSLRQFAGYYIICNDDASTSDSCLLVIRHHPVVSKCRFTSADGNVSGYSFVEKMFSSDDIYTCDWKAKNKVGKEVNKGTGTWGNSMLCNNKDRPELYCSGNCSFTAPLPKDKGIYNYTIIVLGSNKDACWQTITVEHNENTAMTDDTPPDETPPDGDQKYVFVGASIGLLIICTVAVAVIFSRRKLRQQNTVKTLSPHQQKDDFEDHVNNVYQSAYAVTPQHHEKAGDCSGHNTNDGVINILEDDEHHYYSICDSATSADTDAIPSLSDQH